MVWGVLSLAAQVVAAGCAEWNTRGFFESATLEQLEGCLDAGAEVNARDGDGDTPLHNAARFNDNPAVITALLDAGAYAAARDDEGKIPWDYVKERDALRGSDAWRLNGLSLATQVFGECARWNTLALPRCIMRPSPAPVPLSSKLWSMLVPR